jgi:NAD(P)-dependent dehydrogenase (short-subunit alcohol dehydrogenase family)
MLEELFRVNAIAPLRIAEAFVEHVAASEQKKIATISSSIGSIGQTRGSSEGGLYAYRMSKAAVNMAMAALAGDLAPRGIAVGVYCPGWVRTSMGGPRAPLTPEESVAGLRARIASLDASHVRTIPAARRHRAAVVSRAPRAPCAPCLQPTTQERRAVRRSGLAGFVVRDAFGLRLRGRDPRLQQRVGQHRREVAARLGA